MKKKMFLILSVIAVMAATLVGNSKKANALMGCESICNGIRVMICCTTPMGVTIWEARDN